MWRLDWENIFSFAFLCVSLFQEKSLLQTQPQPQTRTIGTVDQHYLILWPWEPLFHLGRDCAPAYICWWSCDTVNPGAMGHWTEFPVGTQSAEPNYSWFMFHQDVCWARKPKKWMCGSRLRSQHRNKCRKKSSRDSWWIRSLWTWVLLELH